MRWREWMLGAATLALVVAGEGRAEPVGEDGRVEARWRRTESVDVTRWHQALKRELAPVARARAALLEAVEERGRQAVWPVCRELEERLAEVEEEDLFPAPSLAVSFHLREALESLRGATRSCAGGRYFGMTWRLERSERSFREMTLALGRHRRGGTRKLVVLRR